MAAAAWQSIEAGMAGGSMASNQWRGAKKVA